MPKVQSNNISIKKEPASLTTDKHEPVRDAITKNLKLYDAIADQNGSQGFPRISRHRLYC